MDLILFYGLAARYRRVIDIMCLCERAAPLSSFRGLCSSGFGAGVIGFIPANRSWRNAFYVFTFPSRYYLSVAVYCVVCGSRPGWLQQVVCLKPAIRMSKDRVRAPESTDSGSTLYRTGEEEEKTEQNIKFG